MKKVFNFSAGPSTLPDVVLKEAQTELINYKNTGISVMEMSHRSSVYEAVHQEVIDRFKDLMHIPESYEVLFIQGGASMQFAMIPMNFANDKKAYYVDAGIWGQKAYEEGKRVLKDNAVLLASSKDIKYSNLPTLPEIPEDAAYLHLTSNNTTEGTMMRTFPKTNVPIIVDMSSNILSVDYDISKIDMLYAGAQKNLGPAGVTVVIVKKSLLDTITHDNLPKMLDYRSYAATNSMYNTPPTYSIYLMGLVLKWVDRLGGVKEMEKRATEKANMLYNFLDTSKLFKATVTENRSINNITFTTGDQDLDAKVLEQTTNDNLINLKGHRLVGGLRASIYNAMEKEGVEVLIRTLQIFENKFGDKYV